MNDPLTILIAQFADRLQEPQQCKLIFITGVWSWQMFREKEQISGIREFQKKLTFSLSGPWRPCQRRHCQQNEAIVRFIGSAQHLFSDSHKRKLCEHVQLGVFNCFCARAPVHVWGECTERSFSLCTNHGETMELLQACSIAAAGWWQRCLGKGSGVVCCCLQQKKTQLFYSLPPVCFP